MKAFIKERLHDREDVKIKEVGWMGPYTYVVLLSELIGVKFTVSSLEYMFAWLTRLLKAGCLSQEVVHTSLLPTSKLTIILSFPFHRCSTYPQSYRWPSMSMPISESLMVDPCYQGMNTGILDSFNISWKLSLVLKGFASPSILDTVTEERLPVVKEMLNITSSTLKTTNAGEVEWKRSDALKQYGVNYRHSSIIVDDGSESELAEVRKVSAYGGGKGFVFAGDRAPDAAGLLATDLNFDKDRVSTRLFKLFGSTHHTVLVFINKGEGSDAPASPRFPPEVLRKYPSELVKFFIIYRAGKAPKIAGIEGLVRSFEDTKGHAYEAYRDLGGVNSTFIVRPDGFVGARLKDLGGVERYFTNLLVKHI